MSNCPTCSSAQTVKNGRIHNGKQRFLCRECGRQFVEQPSKRVIDAATRELIDRLLLERISLAGIDECGAGVRDLATTICEREICSCAALRCGHAQKKGRLTISSDELWSFVDNKGNKQWVWLALDADTGEIVGVYIGARDETAAPGLWESLPAVYRQCAVAYTDFWQADAKVLSAKRHRAVGKQSGRTSYIQRFNNTLRQRVSRGVPKTLSFSKSLENHIGAIWYFVHYYNASLLV